MKTTDFGKVKQAITSSGVYLVPEDFLSEMILRQDEILKFVHSMNRPAMEGYMNEKEASAMLGKKTTWFWQMRRSGKLPYKRIGKTIYYSLPDINGLIKNEV